MFISDTLFWWLVAWEYSRHCATPPLTATSPCSWQVFWCVFSFVGRKQEPGGSWSKGNSCSGASAKLRRPWFSFCAAVSLTLLTTKGKNSPPPPPPPPKKKNPRLRRVRHHLCLFPRKMIVISRGRRGIAKCRLPFLWLSWQTSIFLFLMQCTRSTCFLLITFCLHFLAQWSGLISHKTC